MRTRFLLLVGLLAGCSLTDQMESPEPVPPALGMVPLTCQVDLTREAMTCGGPQGVPGRRIVGNQGFDIRLASSNIQVAGGIFSVDVTVRNLGDIELGAKVPEDTTGIFVFFVDGPTVAAGSGDIAIDNADVTETFTAAGQQAFQYDTVLGADQVSTPKTWQLSFDPGVDWFTFTVLVAAELPQVGVPYHWGSVSGSFTRGTGNALFGAVNGPTSALIFYSDHTYLHKNASGWDRFPMPPGVDVITPQDLAGGDDTYYALSNYTLFRIDGSHWTEFNPRGLFVYAFDAGSDGTLALLAHDPSAGTGIVTAFDGTSWHDKPIGNLFGGALVWDRSEAVVVDGDGKQHQWFGGAWSSSSIQLLPGGPMRMWGIHPGYNGKFFASWSRLDLDWSIYVAGVSMTLKDLATDAYWSLGDRDEGGAVGADPINENYFVWDGGSNTEIREMSMGGLVGSTGIGFPWMAGPLYDENGENGSWLVGLENGTSAHL